MDRLERVQRRARKENKGPGSLPEQEMVGELGLFSLEKRLQSGLSTMFLCLRGSYKEDGDSLFIRSHIEKMSGNRYKLLLKRFLMDIG